jgi:hypothetical protein
LTNAFSDVERPDGCAPFGIRSINGLIYVTFAVQDEDKHDDVAGPGHGLVDVFGPGGRRQKRLVNHCVLNSPVGAGTGEAKLWQWPHQFNPRTGAFPWPVAECCWPPHSE